MYYTYNKVLSLKYIDSSYHKILTIRIVII